MYTSKLGRVFMDKQHKIEPLDFSVLHGLNKKSKKSTRWITCSICNKTITKNSMVRHYFAFHHSSDNHA